MFPGLGLPEGKPLALPLSCLACPLNEWVKEERMLGSREGWHAGEGGWDWGSRDL